MEEGVDAEAVRGMAGSAAYWIALHGWFCLFSYRTQDHMPTACGK